MKRLVLTSLLFAGTSLLGMSDDLWKEYDAALKADKPRTQLEILDRIIEKSASDRNSWDFYDAWTKKVSTGSGINWKDRGGLVAAKDSALAAYGEPVIDLVCGRMDMAAVLNSSSVLKRKSNRDFYEKGNFWATRGSAIYGKALSKLVRNDYEFALWYLLGRSEGQEAVALKELILQTAGAQSQQAAYAEYDELSRRADRPCPIADKSALYEKYGKRWNGSAASLLAGQMLLSLKMDTLCLDRTSTSGSFRKLREECAAFEQKRASFSGTGRILAQECRIAAGLIERLDSREVRVVADSAGVNVIFRNMKEALLEISGNDARSRDTIYFDTVRNTVDSYYIADTVAVPFPVKDDGDYVARVSSEDVKDVCHIARHSISAAAVNDARGYKLYAAAYDSGRPLSKYDVAVYLNGSDIPVASRDSICQEGGFVLLPDTLSSAFESSSAARHYLSCSYTDSCGVYHSSGHISFSRPLSVSYPDAGDGKLKAVLLTDCGAYHRGDAVHCKGILYSGYDAENMSVAPKHTRALISLLDPDERVIASKEVKTNDSGSVVADFVLPSDIKGGVYTIVLESGERLSSTTLRVDDFVLPDFECVFDRIDSLCFAGDSVVVSGRIKSYTGHRVPVSSAFYELPWRPGKEKVVTAPDGTFRVKVPTPEFGYWGGSFALTVNTADGSTLQFSKGISLTRWLDLRVELENKIPASISRGNEFCSVLNDAKGIFKLDIVNSDEVPQRREVSYIVRRDTLQTAAGTAYSGERLEMEFEEEGEYEVEFKASAETSSGEIISSRTHFTVIRVNPEAESVSADVENLFIPRPENGIAFDFAASRGPVWAVVSLYGENAECLYEGMMNPDGKEYAGDGTLVRFTLPYEETYPDSVTLRVFYFRNGELYQWSHEYGRPVVEEEFPLSWSRFEDKAEPGTEYTFTLNAAPSSEIAVSVFDKSTETVHSNLWNRVEPYRKWTGAPYLGFVAGTMSGSGMMLVKSMASNDGAASVLMRGEGQDVAVRSDFSTTLCWQPQLKVPQKGEVDVTFRTSDKTGTFVLSAFAHDQMMRNAVERREMVVSFPVELSVSEPVMLHEGDRYVLKAVVSTSDFDVSGTLALEAGGIGGFSREVEISRMSSAVVEFVLEVPYGVAQLPVKIIFTDKAGRYSDALAFSVAVASSVQVLTESHSTLLRDGSDRDAALALLRTAFVNTDPDGADAGEISVPEMLVAAMAPHKAVSEKNVLGLSDAIATNVLYNHLTGGNEDVSGMKAALAEFINPDGGFAWIGGMSSSPIVTSTVLERNARVQVRTGEAFLNGDIVLAAVQYLDRQMFSRRSDRYRVFGWSPDISLETYLLTRSFYPDVPFETAAEDEDIPTPSKEFGDAVDAYLFPNDLRSLPGRIFAKVQRLATLENIYASVDGEKLLEGWRVGEHPVSDVLASMQEDIESLVEYAVPHRDGGIYYPNLVMPYRGLLASEAYCHSLLCDLLAPYDAATADGIRLWLLLQKETQAWESDFAFTNAAASVMGGSDRLKNTSVMVLSKDYTRPYREIQAAGNGFRISRYFVLTSADGSRSVLKAGDAVKAGDKVTAVYKVWNAENRSFVKLGLPTYACLRPVQQLSGAFRWGLRPLVGGTSGFAPQGYREVRYDRIDYYFDTFPEEDVEIKDEFFVTQTGTFTAPVVTVESLYAPHYRANGSFEGDLNAR
ncbi:MAG: hypothetical protein KBS53_05360 [Bacteroidales bacterium]|nr:hypothetical protein [Candidatus Hennigimonas equi]